MYYDKIRHRHSQVLAATGLTPVECIVKERFRCHKFGFEDMVILIACGLHNFRISHKMSHITN